MVMLMQVMHERSHGSDHLFERVRELCVVLKERSHENNHSFGRV